MGVEFDMSLAMSYNPSKLLKHDWLENNDNDAAERPLKFFPRGLNLEDVLEPCST